MASHAYGVGSHPQAVKLSISGRTSFSSMAATQFLLRRPASVLVPRSGTHSGVHPHDVDTSPPVGRQQATTIVQADDSRVEVFDNWYDPSSSAVIAQGGARETRSDRLAVWNSRLTSTVSKLRNELRSTRMELFESREEARVALARVQGVQDSLIAEAEVCSTGRAVQQGSD